MKIKDYLIFGINYALNRAKDVCKFKGFKPIV